MALDYPFKRVPYTVSLSTSCSHWRETDNSSRSTSGTGTCTQSSGVVAQRCHRTHRSPSSSQGIFFNLFSGHKERRQVSPYLGFKKLKSFFQISAVQNVTHNRCVAGHHAARLVCDTRFKECLFSYSDCTRAQALICHRGSNISVQVSSVWPGFGTKSFFKVRPGSIGTTPEDWHGVLPYLDDWLVCAASPQQVMDQTRHLLEHIIALGITVNWDKCKLVPTQSTSYIGLALNSVTMSACPTSERIGSILRAMKEASGGSHSALCGSLETLGEAHSSNSSSTTRDIVAQAIPALAHPKTPVSDTRQIHKNESHTSLHASPSTLVTAAVSPHMRSIRTSTCTLGSHKDRWQSSRLGGGGGVEYGAGGE